MGVGGISEMSISGCQTASGIHNVDRDCGFKNRVSCDVSHVFSVVCGSHLMLIGFQEGLLRVCPLWVRCRRKRGPTHELHRTCESFR